MRIAVDANQGWRVTIVADAPRWDLERAKRFADACADAGVAWIEEPLAMDGYDDLAALTAHSRVPIAGGELHSSGLPELRMMIERRCYDVFQPDAVFTGGIAQTCEVIRLCREHGLAYSPHTWTNGIGFAVNLQLMSLRADSPRSASSSTRSRRPGWTVEARDGILDEPFVHDRGTLQVPTAPGLGIRDRRARPAPPRHPVLGDGSQAADLVLAPDPRDQGVEGDRPGPPAAASGRKRTLTR